MILTCIGLTGYVFLIFQITRGLYKLRKISLNPKTTPTSESISVVISARNEEGYIDETLNSILEQSTKQLKEIIVINDRSNDGTTKIIEGFKNKDARIILINQKSIDRKLSPKKQALILYNQE